MKIKQLHSRWQLKAIFDAVKEEEVLKRGKKMVRKILLFT